MKGPPADQHQRPSPGAGAANTDADHPLTHNMTYEHDVAPVRGPTSDHNNTTSKPLERSRHEIDIDPGAFSPDVDARCER